MPLSQSLQEKPALAGFVLLCFAVAGLGSLARTPALDGWYATLRKPSWTAPNWVFGSVWSLFYLGMAIAAWLIWRERARTRTNLLLFLFATQLVLNLFWSILFFGWQLPGPAFVEILLLWSAILATLVTFSRVSTLAAWLFVPYLVWVTFAAFLNLSILQLN